MCGTMDHSQYVLCGGWLLEAGAEMVVFCGVV